MKLSRTRKILLGVATCWPPLYVLLFIVVWVSLFARFVAAAHGSPNVTPDDFPSGVFLAIFPLHVLTMVVGLGLLVVYVLHALNNTKLEQNTRVLWAILLFVGNVIAMPIYFFKFVLPLEDDAA